MHAYNNRYVTCKAAKRLYFISLQYYTDVLGTIMEIDEPKMLGLIFRVLLVLRKYTFIIHCAFVRDSNITIKSIMQTQIGRSVFILTKSQTINGSLFALCR